MTVTAVVLAVIALAWTVVFLAARIAITRRERARLDALDRMRPLALRVVYEDEAPDVSSLDERDAEALATLVARFGRQVRGETRERLAAFFERFGIADEQRRRLRRRSAWKRATAAFLLGDIGDRDTVPALLDALDDRDRAVRIASARSLGSLGAVEAAEPLVASVAARRIPWVVGGSALIDLGAGAAPTLRSLAANDGSPLRSRAIELLGLVGDPSDAPAVLEALGAESPDLRGRAARALGRLGAHDAVDALRRALADPEPEVVTAAATSLGAIGDRTVVGDLLDVASGESFEAARAAARSAATIEPRAVIAAADAPGASAHVQEAADLVAMGT